MCLTTSTCVLCARSKTILRSRHIPILDSNNLPDWAANETLHPIYRMCLVRNPYERLLSAYLDKVLSKGADPR